LQQTVAREAEVARSDTLVFIPALNEEASLPAVLDELHRELPGADLLVVDDGSTDATSVVARQHASEVLRFDVNQGLTVVIAAGYGYALREGYLYCGRVDADGQHPVPELLRLLERVRSGACDVAVGSRFVSGDGYEPYRYRPTAARALGTSLLRRAMALRLGRDFGDATSGMYAANRKALPLLSQPYTSGAPEVESLIRLSDAGLVVCEVPVDMRERASGESKLRGKRAVKLVLTVVGTLVAVEGLRRVASRRLGSGR
jgi:glycosyltransferase involved in cell wall biosynthesis